MTTTLPTGAPPRPTRRVDAGMMRALAAVEARLCVAPCLERVLLRIEAAAAAGKAPHRATAADARAVVTELLRHQRIDGSWHRDAFATADALLQLRALDRDGSLAPQLRRWRRAAWGWLEGTLGKDGAFAAHCSHAAHDARLCHHFVPPCYSPGHAQRTLRGARLADGTTFDTDADARLCSAACAARELAMGERWRTGLGLQLGWFARVLALPAPRREPLPDSLVAAALLDALLAAPRNAARERAIEAGYRLVLARQRGDGTWPNGTFFILDVLTRAADRESLTVRAALENAARHLVWTYGGNETAQDNPQRLIVAWRTLRRVTESG